MGNRSTRHNDKSKNRICGIIPISARKDKKTKPNKDNQNSTKPNKDNQNSETTLEDLYYIIWSKQLIKMIDILHYKPDFYMLGVVQVCPPNNKCNIISAGVEFNPLNKYFTTYGRHEGTMNITFTPVMYSDKFIICAEPKVNHSPGLGEAVNHSHGIATSVDHSPGLGEAVDHRSVIGGSKVTDIISLDFSSNPSFYNYRFNAKKLTINTMKEYKNIYSDRLRNILIETSLSLDTIDSIILPFIFPSVESISDLCDDLKLDGDLTDKNSDDVEPSAEEIERIRASMDKLPFRMF